MRIASLWNQARVAIDVLRVVSAPCVALGLTALLATAACCADALPDPTRPASLGPRPEVKLTERAALHLEAILGSGNSRVAIVNGRVVREGEHVADVVVTAIGAEAIHYTRGGRDLVAILPASKITVRTPVALHASQP
jgi:hypothetical protein